jgi:hypothetical protein
MPSSPTTTSIRADMRSSRSRSPTKRSTEGCGDWVPAPRSGPRNTTIGEGTWAVGIDIAPCTYSTTLPEDSNGCYWQRARDFTEESDSIIANDNAGARATVTIKATDKALRARDAGHGSGE